MRTAYAFVALLLAATCSCSPPPPPPNDSGSGVDVSIDAPPVTPPECREVSGICHSYDMGSGIAHECHELGHGGTAAECTARRAECLAACPPRDSGVEDAMPTDH